MAEMTWQEREQYKARMRAQETEARNAARAAQAEHDRQLREQAAAEREIGRIGDAAQRDVQRLLEAEERAARGAEDELKKFTIAAEREALGAPRTVRRGGTVKNPNGIGVYHWKTGMDGLKYTFDDAPAGFGPLVYLPPGGGIDPRRAANANLVAAAPDAAHDPAVGMWERTRLGPAWEETMSRYGLLLGNIRRDDWWAELAERTGLTLTENRVDTHQGTFETITQKVTVIDVPTLIQVRIEQDGLVLRFAHRTGDTAERWSRCVPALRAAFKALDVPADNIRVAEDAAGNIELHFDDAPVAFPTAIAPEPPETAVADRADAIARYHAARWVLGVDARGNTLSYPMKSIPHVLVSGGTGGGKSVWARTTIEALRVNGFTCFIGSGKVSDFAALEGLPGVAMVAGDPAQTAVMVRTVRREMERRNVVAAEAKRQGESDAFSFPPILLVLDEWGATEMLMKSAYKKSDSFMQDIDLLLRVGREARVHVALLSQTIRKTGDGAVPGSWQENLGLTVALGSPSEITLLSDAFTEESRPRARVVGARLKGKRGRGLTAERETGRVVEFQSFYGWSPGTTSLAAGAAPEVAPPTPEVRAAWARWVPVSDAVPPIMPRLGIKADGPDWADGELDAVADTPTVPLTDKHGAPIPDRAQYDPASPAWLGRAQVDHLRGAGIDFDDAPAPAPAPAPSDPAPAPAPEPVTPEPVTPEPVTPEPVTAEDDEDAYRALIAAEARRMGLIPEPESPATAEPEPTPAPAPEPEPEPEPEPQPTPAAPAAPDDEDDW
jgi:hypothetical protein